MRLQHTNGTRYNKLNSVMRGVDRSSDPPQGRSSRYLRQRYAEDFVGMALTLWQRIVVVALATVIRLVLDPFLGDSFPFLAFFVAIVFAAWYGGYGPSLLALVLSWLSFDYFLRLPHDSQVLYGSKSQIAFAFFAAGWPSLSWAGPCERPQACLGQRLRGSAAFEDQQANREWLQITLASIADGVITTDPEGQVISLNPAAQRLTGWGVQEARGRPLGEVLQIVQGESQKRADFTIAEVVQNGQFTHRMIAWS